jgi:hypothetical protein
LASWKGVRRARNPYGSSASNYIEAQIHGGVGTADIAAVIFHRKARPSKKLREWMEANKIPFMVGDD